MRITQRIPKFSVVIIILIFFCIAYGAGAWIAGGKVKSVYISIALSILCMLPYIVGKIGIFPFFCGLVFIYWIPFLSGLSIVSPFLDVMYPVEFGMWMLFLGIIIHDSVTRSKQLISAARRFPFLPFALLIAGSLIANLVSGNLFAHSELARIRVLCLLPAVICFVCIYFINTVAQAERLLWIFLLSSLLLGVVYLFAPSFSYLSGLAVEEGGRIVRVIQLPLFMRLRMSAETTPICFGFVISMFFSLWLNHPSARVRSITAGALIVPILVIIRSQGRAGLIAVTCSVMVIQVLSLRFKSSSNRILWVNLLKPTIIIFALLFSIWHFARTSKIDYFREHGLSLFAGNPFKNTTLFDRRIDRWETAFDVVCDNPLGVGIYGFPSASGESWVAHNFYLYLLLCFGIIGFIGYFWIFVRYTKACWSGLNSNSPNRRLLCIGGMGCVTTLFVAGLASCIYWPPREVFMVWIPIGITMAVATLPERARSQ